MKKELVVITGASSGIGRSTAIKLSEEGYPLLIIGRRIERLQALKLPQAICAQVDIKNKLEVKKCIEEAIKKFGPVGTLINNAGLMLLGDIGEQDSKEWEDMFEVNVMALLNLIDIVIPDMKKRNIGTIINISSIAGKKSFPHHTAYSGTKFAVHGISETLREEVAPYGLRVITISPGAVETELLDHTKSEEIKRNYKNWKVGMGGVIGPDDVASSIHFVLSQPQNVCIRELVIASTKQAQ